MAPKMMMLSLLSLLCAVTSGLIIERHTNYDKTVYIQTHIGNVNDPENLSP